MSDSIINEGQREQYLLDGYTLLPGALPAELLSRWRELTDRMEQDALAAAAKGTPMHGACVIEDPVGPRLVRLDDLLGTATDEVLDLLACPAMMAVARELCGCGTVPLQVDVLFKHQHPHPVIGWHQGAPHPRGYPYLNVGIYLDDAGADDGCLLYVPETQHELQDICSLTETHGWAIPGTIQSPAKAGDILVQDMMILHGSGPKTSEGVRRTIYVELRPDAGILESGKQSERWAELRRRWMALAVRRAAPGEWPEAWGEHLPSDLLSDGEEAAAILEHWDPPIPAVYCHRNIETEDYPIPSRLRGSSAPDAQ